jgi:DNA ligase-1
MKHFTHLFTQLDQSTKTLEKVNALKEYFESASDEDKLWAVALLSHRRPKRTVNASLLAEWATQQSGFPSWLFEESYHIVGDLAEAITLVLPPAKESSSYSFTYWINFIRALESMDVSQKKEKIEWAWQRLNESERFVFNKLITGGFRVGVSQQLMVKALARYSKVKENILAHRLMGNWSPESGNFQELIFSEEIKDISRPYPFYLAYALEQNIEDLGEPGEWQAEWKWDGIRGQVIVRDRKLFVWSRGEELVTDKYPEFSVLLDFLPDGTVLDGEILPFKHNQPMSFQHLQQRIGRKTIGVKLLKDVPVAFVTYDLLEWNSEDVRGWKLEDRRKKLQEIVSLQNGSVLRLSPVIVFQTWEQLTAIRLRSRENISEGIMLKKKDSVYRDGRRKGDWWKWKIDPFTVDAVMIYAMNGHGRRANLFTDYTFAVWDKGQLVPFTKAYSGLTDEEIQKVDRWVKQNTLERFGPVRSVKPELVFELAFEGIQKSTRHKSGIALRFPRIKRWRTDKPASEANLLSDLLSLLEK